MNYLDMDSEQLINELLKRDADIQALRKDAERLDWLDATNAPFKMGWRFGIAPAGNVHPYTVAQLYGALTTVREGIDAAMEKQP